MNDLEKEFERLIEEIMQYIRAFDSYKGSSPENHENNNVREDLEMLCKLLLTGDSEAKSFFEEKLHISVMYCGLRTTMT